MLDFRLKLALCVIIASLWRWDVWGFQSQDFLDFLQPWYDFIRSHGGVGALGHSFYNYNPTYIYLLVLWHYLFPSFSALDTIKSLGLVLDGLGCVVVYYWVARLRPWSQAGWNPWGLAAAVVLWLTPTVLLNSAYWGQCDMGYTAAVLAGLYGLSQGHQRWGLVALTLGLALKLQTAFTLPLVLVLLLQGQLRWRHLGWVPLTYGLTLVPAALAGRSWGSLVSVYWQQFNTYDRLTLNAPSIYQWFPQADYDRFVTLGLLLTGAVTFTLVGLLFRRFRCFTPLQLVQVALGFNLLLPWLLPKMHDRYLFTADVLSVVLAFGQPGYGGVALVTVAVSLGSYAPYLLGREVVPLGVLALVLGVLVVEVWRRIFEGHDPVSILMGLASDRG